MSIVAGVDSSTQSCTVELRSTTDGRLLARASAPHRPTTPPRSEQNPEDWWEAFCAAFARTCSSAGVSASDVGGIAVGAQCHGLVLMDNEGRVLRPAKLWNDTTSAPQAAAMVEKAGMASWAREIGLVPSAALTITKLRWVFENEPELLDRAAFVCVPHDYLTWRLTGEHVTDRSDAAGTGYFGLGGSWRTDLLSLHVTDGVDWPGMLPRILGHSESAGRVSAIAAKELGLRSDVLVGPGGGDQHLGAVGLGIRTGDVAISLGTSGVVMTPCETPVVDESGWVDCVADATGGFLPLVCTLNSTKVTDAFARILGVSLERLDELAASADATQAPTFLAYMDGERSPRRPDASGLMSGLRSDITPGNFALSAFQGVVAGLARGWAAMTDVGLARTGQVVVTGGGARAQTYLQLIADAFGVPAQVRDADAATARGASVQAAAIVGGARIDEVRDAWTPQLTAIVDPRAGSANVLSKGYLRLARLEDQRLGEIPDGKVK